MAKYSNTFYGSGSSDAEKREDAVRQADAAVESLGQQGYTNFRVTKHVDSVTVSADEPRNDQRR